MQIEIHQSYDALSRAAADKIVKTIHEKKDALLCIASGHTPIGVLQCLVNDVKSKKLDISACHFVGLDEWIGVDEADEGSCRFMMDKDLFLPLQIPLSRIHFFDPKKDLQSECNRINELIDIHGGLDLMLAGIGTNGHIAMNEPGTSFDSIAHVSELAEETIRVGQKYFKKQTPLSKGITLGLKHFREAKLPIILASGKHKAAIIKKTTTNPPDEKIPSTIAQLIPHSYVMLDRDAASEL